MAVQPPLCDFGWKAPDFSLPGIDGKTYTLADVRGPKGALVMFICNHCPYARAIVDRLVRDVRELQLAGIGAAAVMPNDTDAYPDDSFENMKLFARKYGGFPFPYLIDPTQQVARAYGAVCTPDFFGFDSGFGLQYRGRLDASRKEPAPNARRELLEAMLEVARTGRGPQDQQASMGCSIKWRSAA